MAWRPTRSIGLTLLLSLLAALAVLAALIAVPVTMRGLVVIAALGLVVPYLALRYQDAAMVVLIALLPLTGVLAFDLGFTVIPVFIPMVVLLGRDLITRRVLDTPRAPVSAAVVLYCAAAVIAAVVGALFRGATPLREVSGLGLRYTAVRPVTQLVVLLVFAGVFFVTAAYARDSRRKTLAVRAYLLVSTLIAAYAVYQQVAYTLELPLKNLNVLGGARDYDQFQRMVVLDRPDQPTILVSRSNATFEEPLRLGHFLLGPLGLMMALGTAPQRGRIFSRRFAATSLAILALGVFSSMSVGALFGLAGSACALAAVRLARREFPIRAIATAAAIAIAFIAGLEFAGVHLFGAAAQKVAASIHVEFGPAPPPEVLVTRRGEYFLEGLEIARERPLVGVGLGNSGEEILRRAPHLHLVNGLNSLPALVMAEMGALGLAALVALLTSFGALTYRASRTREGDADLSLGFLIGLVGFGCQYLYGVGSIRLDPYVWFFLGLGTAHAHAALARRTP